MLKDFFADLVFWIDDSLSDDMKKKVFRHVVAYGGTVEKKDASLCNYVVTEKKDGWMEFSKKVVSPTYIFQCHAKQKLI